MKKVLIVGANSYVGTAIAEYLKMQEDYKVSSFDILGIDPEIINFSDYDIVIQAAGVEPSKKINKKPELYYEINRDLAFHTVYIAKACGIKQFIVFKYA